MLLHETNNEPQEGMNRRLRTYKVDSDETMIELHNELIKDVDIVTQIERSYMDRGELVHVTYVMTQKITVIPPDEVKKLLKSKKKK